MSESLSHRRISWTRNTNYVSVASPRAPMEVGSHAHAPNKNVEQQLETSKQRINQLHRKSLVMLAGQRKLLEKSMLAYTEKMKEIADKRTSNLFREIQSRNGSKSKSLPDIHSPHERHKELLESTEGTECHTVNSREDIESSALNTHLASGGKERSQPTKKQGTDFSKLRSLLRRASSADLIDLVRIRQEQNDIDYTKRFASTQSLIETADYLESYRQKVQSEFKPKKRQGSKLIYGTQLRHDNYDSAYSSGFDSNDELSESDTKRHPQQIMNSQPSSARTQKSKQIKRKMSVAKPKVNKKGRKLLMKLNAVDNSYNGENLHKVAVYSSLASPNRTNT